MNDRRRLWAPATAEKYVFAVLLAGNGNKEKMKMIRTALVEHLANASL